LFAAASNSTPVVEKALSLPGFGIQQLWDRWGAPFLFALQARLIFQQR
jgi:hypothetical protein